MEESRHQKRKNSQKWKSVLADRLLFKQWEISLRANCKGWLVIPRLLLGMELAANQRKGRRTPEKLNQTFVTIKKLRSFWNTSIRSSVSIRGLLCYSKANIYFTDRSSLTAASGLKQEQQRSSVIVSPATTSSFDLVKVNTDKNKNGEKEKEEEEDEGLVLPEMENIDMKDLKDIQTICMSFLAEEPPFMQEKQQLFYNAWYEVNHLILWWVWLPWTMNVILIQLLSRITMMMLTKVNMEEMSWYI